MKVSVTQENLAKALNIVLRATAQKSNIPVLGNILFSTEKGKLNLSATNLEISINTWIGSDIAEEGQLTVNARLIAEFVNQLKSSRVELIQAGQSLEVKSVDNRAQLFIVPAEDFPALPEPGEVADMVCLARDLKEGILKTIVAVSADQSRGVLTGLLLESSQRKLALVGVDGFRLAKKIIKLEKGQEKNLKVVIPAKAMLEIAKIISDICDENDMVNIFYLEEKRQIVFRINDVILTSRLIEGDFPEYQQIIPSEKIVEVKMEAAEFTNSLKIVSIFARNVIGNKSFLKIIKEDKKAIVSASVNDMGNNESTFPIITMDGEDFETAFNIKYLLDMIGTLDSEKVTFQSNGATAPGLFLDEKDPDYLHVVMPMRME